LSISDETGVGAGGDPSKMIRSDVLGFCIGWPPASSSNKLVLVEDSVGEISVVTSLAGVSVWRRICVLGTDGVISMVIKPTLMMISALCKCLAESWLIV